MLNSFKKIVSRSVGIIGKMKLTDAFFLFQVFNRFIADCHICFVVEQYHRKYKDWRTFRLQSRVT